MAGYSVQELIAQGDTLAAADRILIDPEPSNLGERVDKLLGEIQQAEDAHGVSQALLRLGMNFAGRDAELVGYSAEEADQALAQVLAAFDNETAQQRETTAAVVNDFLADMKSVNKADSLSGLLAERIEPELDSAAPGRSFLELFKRIILLQ